MSFERYSYDILIRHDIFRGYIREALKFIPLAKQAFFP